MTNLMVLGNRYSKMAQLLRASSSSERNVDSEFYNGLMALSIAETG